MLFLQKVNNTSSVYKQILIITIIGLEGYLMSEEYEWNDEDEGKKLEEEKPVEILTPQEEPPTSTVSTYEPPSGTEEPLPIDEAARKKKKRRNWILISIFGITLPILLIIGSLAFVMLAILGAFETCAVNCCTSCGDQCAQTCNDTCCTSCSESCNNACNDSCSNACSGCDCGSSCTCGTVTKISGTKHLMNQLQWIIYKLFGFFK